VDLNLEPLQRTYCGRGSRPHRPDLLLKREGYLLKRFGGGGLLIFPWGLD
jgi:hypothetical protein